MQLLLSDIGVFFLRALSCFVDMIHIICSSERASATNNRGEQLRQGANINKSLLSLANCINALAGNRRRRGGKASFYRVFGSIVFAGWLYLFVSKVYGNCCLQPSPPLQRR